MKIESAITIIQTYQFADIDADGKSVRKHIATSDINTELLRSYLDAYGSIQLVPKKANGNSPIRLVGNAITVEADSRGLAGIDTVSAMPVSAPVSGGSSADLYRILYETAKDEARDYKRKYEDVLNEKHKVELELAGNRNSVVGDIAQGLAGFAPLLMGGMGGNVGVGSIAQTPQPAQPAVKPVTDVKLAAIIQYYNKLDETDRDKVYQLLAKVFGDISKIDSLIQTL